MSLKDLFSKDEDIIFSTDDFAVEATYYFKKDGTDQPTQVIPENLLALDPSSTKETTIFKLRKSFFNGKPLYQDKIMLSGNEVWTVERVIDVGRINFTVLARRGER
jgi:hypothetical protein